MLPTMLTAIGRFRGEVTTPVSERQTNGDHKRSKEIRDARFRVTTQN